MTHSVPLARILVVDEEVMLQDKPSHFDLPASTRAGVTPRQPR